MGPGGDGDALSLRDRGLDNGRTGNRDSAISAVYEPI